ncbi:MAG: DUF4355 domain-containing protein [Peptostreptococcaceae bacterium]
MKKSELLKLIENLGEEEVVNELLLGTDVEEQIKSNALTLDNFKSKASDKDFKAYLDSLNDKHAEKVISTMKEKGTWETQFKDVLETKYPDLFKIEDPIVAQLKADMDAMRKENEESKQKLAREGLLKDARAYAEENKYPTELLDYFVGSDLDSSKANLDKMNGVISEIVKTAVQADIKGNSYTPPGGKGGTPNTMADQVNSILGL